jgi:hypothetical protein
MASDVSDTSRLASAFDVCSIEAVTEVDVGRAEQGLEVRWKCDGCSGLRRLPYFLRVQTLHEGEAMEQCGDRTQPRENLLESTTGLDQVIAKLPDVVRIHGIPRTEATFLAELYSKDYTDTSSIDESGESLFLSHSSTDKGVVREIAAGLRARGLSPWLDELELVPGDSLILKLSESVRTADYLAVCLSKASVESDWVQKEVSIAIEQERRGGGSKVLVLLLEPITVPSVLSERPLIDFTRGALEEGLEELGRFMQPDGNKLLELLRKVFPEASFQGNALIPELTPELLQELAARPGFALDDEGELIVINEELADQSPGERTSEDES